jgi:hypothetical protein
VSSNHREIAQGWTPSHRKEAGRLAQPLAAYF